MTLDNREQDLWLAVLHQAVQDATAKSIEPQLKQEAIAWLTTPNRDFDAVCENAGKDPVRLRKAIAQRLSAPAPAPRKISKAKPGSKGGVAPRLVTHNGMTMSIPQWAKHLGIKLNTLHVRFQKGWTPAEAFTRPIAKGRPMIDTGPCRRRRGEVSDFHEDAGTGGGSVAHDFPELEFSMNKDFHE